jgi:hypothetical protein
MPCPGPLAALLVSSIALYRDRNDQTGAKVEAQEADPESAGAGPARAGASADGHPSL